MKAPLPSLKTAMTPFPHSVAVDAALDEALAILDAHDFRHLPVTAGAAIAGLVDRATLERALAAGSTGTVGDHCEPAPRVVSIDEPLREVVGAMAAKRLDAVVVTRHGRLAGVFTAVDACRAFAALLTVLAPPPGEDRAA